MDSRAGPSDRARATGLLADVLDAGRRYEEAFEAYEICNRSLRQIHRHYAGSNVLGYTRALTAAVEKIDPDQWRPPVPAEAPEPQAAGHVFLLGFPRSGTTLLEVVLDGNPRVVSLEEHELLADGVLAFMREPVNLLPLARAESQAVECFAADLLAPGARSGRGCRGQSVHRQASVEFREAAADCQAVSAGKNFVRRTRSARRGAELLPAPLQDESVDV